MTRLGLAVLFCGSVFFLRPALSGATITGAKDGNPPTTLTDDPYTVSLTPVPVQHIGTGDPNMNALYAADLKLMNQSFSNFVSTEGKADAAGTFNILQYQPFIVDTDKGHVGGANFTVLYDDGNPATPAPGYEWIQIAHYHNWGTDGSGDKVDGPPKTHFPFYYRVSLLPNLKISNFADLGATDNIWDDKTNYPDQDIKNPKGGGNVPKGGDLLFHDQPYCLLSCADASDHIAYAYFDLFLVKYDWNRKPGDDAAGNVTVLDGIRWGVEITKSPQTFTNPGSIPEPSSYLLLGTGLIAAGLARRRRRS